MYATSRWDAVSRYRGKPLATEINSRFCKSDEAESDRSRAIDLAIRAHDTKAAEHYRYIDIDTCWKDLKGRLTSRWHAVSRYRGTQLRRNVFVNGRRLPVCVQGVWCSCKAYHEWVWARGLL